ncbi:MAG TPA: ATP cone domain-containing protein, partial [Gemmataceae bacterium]|nr:ATP cone domain-containing protein [Gemmataceae bacterium]
MNESLPPESAAWVYKRDGQLVPFDADKISRALFAAGESLGQPDAFLARELADGVVHFLSIENEGETPTTEQIAELVIKVVRELGQPALAEAFARFGEQRRRIVSRAGSQETETPRQASPAAPPGEVVLRFTPEMPLSVVVPACVRSYTLQTVYTRDLVAAQGAGLLTLMGLDSPNELADCVLGPPLDPAAGLIAAIEGLRRFAGQFVVLDGPEHLLASNDRTNVRDFARDFAIALRLTGLQGIVNLNCAAPPSWAGELAEGPLFAAQQRAPTEYLERLTDELLNELLQPTHPVPCAGVVRIDWHLGERDFGTEPARRERLQRLARLALEDAPLAFVFDRPRRLTALAEGVDRQHPAVLLTVGLHLPRLAMQPGIDGDPSKFLPKLGSLARLALSAGVQKREYLRRLERNRPRASADGPALTSAFLLDRARLVVAPVGLDSVVYSFLKKGL